MPLFWQPSYLTIQFLEGRRIRYLNPIQLFLFSSFFYFLIDSVMILKKEDPDIDISSIEGGSIASLDSLDKQGIQAGDTLMFDEVDTSTIANLSREFLEKAKSFDAMDRSRQNKEINEVLSVFVFLLTPVFAGLLYVFFHNKNRKYFESLIFSLHFHAFYFLLGIVFMLFDRLIPSSVDALLPMIFIILYLMFALKRFYNFGWFSTGIRLLGLLAIYSVFTVIGYVISILLSIWN